MFGSKLKRAEKRVTKAITVFEEARVGLEVANSEYEAAIDAEEKRIEEAQKKIAEAQEKQEKAKAGIAGNNRMIAKLKDFLD